MDYNAALEEAIQSFGKLVNGQDDPTTRPYVKDKSFYDSMVNAPIENSKMAAYRDNLANLDLLRIANSKLPGAREALMTTAQGLMKQSSDAAEQDANIRNEMTRRQTVSEALQGMKDMRNPIEALTALKTLKATTGMDYNPAEVTSMLGSKESYDAKKMQGLLSLANAFSGLRGQDMNMALAQLRGSGGYGRGSGGANLNFKDIHGAWKEYNKILSEIEEASRSDFYKNNPTQFKDLIGRSRNQVYGLAGQDPLRGKDMADDFEKRVTELIPEKEPMISKKSYVPADNLNTEELLHKIKEQNGIDY